MLRRRSLALEWVEDTLRDPTVVRVDDRDPSLNLAFKQIRQAGDKWLRVVYRKDKYTHIVITAFFDRNQEKRK
jgi:hypothetical protein